MLKKVEKLKKLSDAEEAAERKKAMDNAIAAKTNGPKSANVKSQDNEYNEEGGSKPLFGRVRSEEEIFDSFMDFKIKKSGCMSSESLPALLGDLGFDREVLKHCKEKLTENRDEGHCNVLKALAALETLLDPKAEGKISKKLVMGWWHQSPDAKTLVEQLRAATAAFLATSSNKSRDGDGASTKEFRKAEHELKMVLATASSEVDMPTQIVKWCHVAFNDALEAIQEANAVTGDNYTVKRELLTAVSAAHSDEVFKRKLGAIFGGSRTQGERVHEKNINSQVPRAMSDAHEDTKAKLAEFMAAKRQQKNQPSSQLPSSPSSRSASSTANVRSSDAIGLLTTEMPTASTKNEIDLNKGKNGGNIPQPIPPMTTTAMPRHQRPSNFGGIVVGSRNLGGVIKLTSDDPRFKKFSMMIKLHLPKHAVAQKMRADGFDPVVLDDIDVDGAPVGNRKLERSAQEERPPKDISSVHIPPTSPTGALPAPVEQLASDISTIRPPKVKATSFRLGDRKRPGSSGFSTSPRASPVRGREFGRAQGPGLSGPQTRPPGDKKDFLKRATSTQATASR